MNRHHLIGALCALTAIGGAAFYSVAQADGIPAIDTMIYSGYLEESGAPVDGTRNVTLRFYDSATVGTELCSSAASNVAIEAGYFRVPLNTACEDAVRDNTEIWVEPQVGIDAPFPRTKLGAVPYAVEAERAQQAGTAERADESASADSLRMTRVSLPDAETLEPPASFPPSAYQPTIQTIALPSAGTYLVLYEASTFRFGGSRGDQAYVALCTTSTCNDGRLVSGELNELGQSAGNVALSGYFTVSDADTITIHYADFGGGTMVLQDATATVIRVAP